MCVHACVWCVNAMWVCFGLVYDAVTAAVFVVQVWYALPGSAAVAFQDAKQDAVPHLMQEEAMLSPEQLKLRGLPVCR